MAENLAAIVLTGGRGSRLGGIDKATLIGPDGRTALDRVLDACAAVGADPVVAVGPPEVVAGFPGLLVTREDPPWSGPARAITAGVEALAAAGVAGGAVLVLACDMPNVAQAVDGLVRAGLARDGRVARVARTGVADEKWTNLTPDRSRAPDLPSPTDLDAIQSTSSRQWLLGLYRFSALAAACARLPETDAPTPKSSASPASCASPASAPPTPTSSCAKSQDPVPGARGPSVRQLLGDLDLDDFPVPADAAADLDTPADVARLRFREPPSADPKTPNKGSNDG